MVLLVAYGAEPHGRHGEDRKKYLRHGMSLFNVCMMLATIVICKHCQKYGEYSFLYATVI